MADKETVIGPETRISGEVRGEEDLIVRGRIDGRVQLTQTLTVRHLIVAGTVVGAIVASESVRLTSTARVVGDLASPRVVMEAGAAYRGRVDMGDIAAARAAVSAHAVQRPAVVEKPATVAATATRPALPRMAPIAKAAVVAKTAAPVAAPVPAARPAAQAAAPAAPPAFPRVAGATGAMSPAWAKKKIRRR